MFCLELNLSVLNRAKFDLFFDWFVTIWKDVYLQFCYSTCSVKCTWTYNERSWSWLDPGKVTDDEERSRRIMIWTTWIQLWSTSRGVDMVTALSPQRRLPSVRNVNITLNGSVFSQRPSSSVILYSNFNSSDKKEKKHGQICHEM